MCAFTCNSTRVLWNRKMSIQSIHIFYIYSSRGHNNRAFRACCAYTNSETECQAFKFPDKLGLERGSWRGKWHGLWQCNESYTIHRIDEIPRSWALRNADASCTYVSASNDHVGDQRTSEESQRSRFSAVYVPPLTHRAGQHRVASPSIMWQYFDTGFIKFRTARIKHQTWHWWPVSESLRRWFQSPDQRSDP